MLTNILQPTHLIVLLVVALVILRPKRLPEAGRAVGQGLKEFKSSISGDHDDDAHDQIEVPPRSTPRSVTRSGAREMSAEQDNSPETDAR